MRSDDVFEKTPEQRAWPRRPVSILADVLGPVGHGPSSSHTIAPQLMALEAFTLLGGTPDPGARVVCYNSFAATGPGHCTDIAVVAGLLGIPPNDSRTPSALGVGSAQRFQVSFEAVEDPGEHPNAVAFHLQRGVLSLYLKCISTGGGAYEVIERRLDRTAPSRGPYECP